MRNILYINLILTVAAVIFSACHTHKTVNIKNDKVILAETDSIEILSQVIDSAKDEFDIPEVAIWLRNKNTGDEKKLLQTVRPNESYWYVSDGTEFIPASIDSIPVVYKAFVINENPLQLIVEGCPDFRNYYSYFIDVPSRKASWVPSNSGYMGWTEEGYMVFRSYRYVSDPDIGGRYTLLQVFNDKGVMVDSLDLKHVILEEYS